MSWKKYLRVVNSPLNAVSEKTTSTTASASSFNNALPDIYAGHPNRIQRYYQYNDMSLDSDIALALDTIADFCTQSEEQTQRPFLINYSSTIQETETKIIREVLEKWIKKNDFKKRLWNIFRETIKNGDTFFLRDPETGEWLWLDHYSVIMVRVDEESGKEPCEYIVRGLDYNKQAKYATTKTDTSNAVGPLGMTQAFGRGVPSSAGQFNLAGTGIDPRNRAGMKSLLNAEMFSVDAKHVVHLSLSSAMDINWPFGQSILEPVFKTFKQKELLEDALIIYRVQRAPERRVFYIDTGNMPPERARAHLQAVRNEIKQRRIPNTSSTGGSIMDSAYNPLGIMEDYWIAQSAEGRQSKVETLPGADNLGELGDVNYFLKKLARGLGIPTSYITYTDEGQSPAWNDGKLGAAVIQEFRFNKFCMRIQNLIAPIFDMEFKKYLKDSGFYIEDSSFELLFNPPQNFSKYRQIELDQQQVNIYQQVSENKKMSERFKFKRFLNLTEEEILENERLWREENPNRIKSGVGSTEAETQNNAPGLGAVGLPPSQTATFGDDSFELPDNEPDMEPQSTEPPPNEEAPLG